jgi:hypothetical protein
MPQFKPKPHEVDPDWRNLRDAKGRLYGRVNRVQLLLELRSHNGRHETVVFDLREVLVIRENDDNIDK